MVWNHTCYLTFSILITALVGRTLHKHGHPFLVDIFGGNPHTAAAVNNLLLAGYYLTNIALVSLGIRYGGEANGLQSSIELLSTKIGWVLVILGGMHFVNMSVLFAIRWPDKTAAVLNSVSCTAKENNSRTAIR